MPKAKTINKEQYERLRQEIDEHSSRVERDRAILALSFKAGLRVAEIAGLSWTNVLDVTGQIVKPGEVFEVPNGIAKKGHGRAIPMHVELYEALCALRAAYGTMLCRGNNPVIVAHSGDRYTANSLQRYLSRLYEACGMNGMSSHSGRRSFITTLARVANEHGCSLYDVQKIAGHSDISTTAEYIDNSDRIGKLVNAL